MKNTIISVVLMGLLLLGGIAPLAMAATQGVKLNAKVGSDVIALNELSVSASDIAVDSGFNANLVSGDIDSVSVDSETKARLGYPKFALVFRGTTEDNEAVTGYLISMKTTNNDLSASSELFKGRLKVGSESYSVSGRSLVSLKLVSASGNNANSVGTRGELSLDLVAKTGVMTIANEAAYFKILRVERKAINPSINARDDNKQNAGVQDNENARSNVLKRILDKNANSNVNAEANANVDANDKTSLFARLRLWFSSNSGSNTGRN